MEVYLVKDEVKKLRVRDAFLKLKMSNGYIKELELEQQGFSFGNSDESDDGLEKGQRKVDRTFLKLYDLPVTLRSVSSEYAAQFANRVERKLTRKEANFEWEKMRLKLIIISKGPDHPKSLEGVLLSPKSPGGSKMNVFTRLYEELGFAHVQFTVQVSLCHLPSEYAPVSPEALVNLEAVGEEIFFRSAEQLVGGDLSVQVPRQLMQWSEQGTGFIYCKTSVKVCLKEKAVDLVYGYVDGNESLLKDKYFTDVEIGCQRREIVKCHRAILANKSRLLRRKFKEILEKGQTDGNWTLEMELSKEDVESFLEYIYCGKVSRGMQGCDAALGLLKAGRKYQVLGLEGKMEEIMLAKGSGDFGYFTVKGALNLYLYVRGVVRLKHLRDKAVRVLQNFLKTKSDIILESEEYLDLFQKQPQVAMELTSLYMQLS